MILGQGEQVRAADKQDRHQQAAAQQAAVPKPADAPSADKAKQQCYPGSKMGVSCDGISAQAAVEQARGTDKQAAVVWPQFGVGVATLLAAVAAAAFAYSAAYHTKRSADVAETNAQDTIKALEIAERNARAAESAIAHAEEVDMQRLRPYVNFISAVIGAGSDGKPAVALSYKNFGQTPATDLEFIFGISVAHPPFIRPEMTDEMTCSVLLGPGQAYTHKLIFKSGAADVRDRVAAGELIILRYGLSYTVPGKGRESLENLMVADEDCMASKQMRFPNLEEVFF